MGVYQPGKRLERPAAYRSRIVDAELAVRLEATGAVLIEGPRGCGKTETARRAAQSEVRLDVDDEARVAGLVAPAVLIEMLGDLVVRRGVACV